MKEAIGGISIFQIVIFFILLFAAIMSLTINHSKAFSTKDEIINIIEEDGVNIDDPTVLKDSTVERIVEQLTNNGHRITGSCPDDDYKGYDRNGKSVNRNAVFCVKANDGAVAYAPNTDCGDGCKIVSEDYPLMYYYDIVLFYQFDIPGLNNLLNFRLYGSTKVLFG